MELFTAAQMKEIDRIAIEERGIPSDVLMERAARALTEEVQKLVGTSERQYSAVIFCGPGNNGGDGVAAARFLLEQGWSVKCVLVGRRETMSADCMEMERRLMETGGVLEAFEPECSERYLGLDVAVDALFGIGLNSPLRAEAEEAVRLMQMARWVVSADIPSGVHADTGEVMGQAVQANVTVTFSGGKPGLYAGKGALHAGRVVVADIGIPDDLMKNGCGVLTAEPPVLPRRKRDAHKGDFGKLFILAGSVGYTGAPVLAARAAVRSGAVIWYHKDDAPRLVCYDRVAETAGLRIYLNSTDRDIPISADPVFAHKYENGILKVNGILICRISP